MEPPAADPPAVPGAPGAPSRSPPSPHTRPHAQPPPASPAPGSAAGSPARAASPGPDVAVRLRDRVNFYEQVWGGERRSGPPADATAASPRPRPDLATRSPPSHAASASTPASTPGDDASFEEVVERMEEEGDMLGGAKVVKFERITMRRSVREYTLPSPATATAGPGAGAGPAPAEGGPASDGSCTPSEERLLLDDSAYHSASHRSAAGASKSSSAASLLGGRFPSDECLRPGRERAGSASNASDSAWDAAAGRHSPLEWYNEYRSQSLQSMAARLEYVRSRSQYDTHIAEIKGTSGGAGVRGAVIRRSTLLRSPLRPQTDARRDLKGTSH
ncbi:hypothetical protein R5R35_001177 [Gryllus longicercus]|uniref:Uncharacterized protein n=1 Tax=Gryllus longicercus TaxID=2509291 RepID=A0AAN9YUS1_9ORTH